MPLARRAAIVWPADHLSLPGASSIRRRQAQAFLKPATPEASQRRASCLRRLRSGAGATEVPRTAANQLATHRGSRRAAVGARQRATERPGHWPTRRGCRPRRAVDAGCVLETRQAQGGRQSHRDVGIPSDGEVCHVRASNQQEEYRAGQRQKQCRPGRSIQRAVHVDHVQRGFSVRLRKLSLDDGVYGTDLVERLRFRNARAQPGRAEQVPSAPRRRIHPYA